MMRARSNGESSYSSADMVRMAIVGVAASVASRALMRTSLSRLFR